MKRIFVLLLTIAALAAAAELPVKQVVLYKHGVGFLRALGKARAGRIGAPRFQRIGDE